MTHTTDPQRARVPAAADLSHARWAEVRVSALAAGASAAGLGLGVPATVVLLLWIASPYPDSGFDGALHVGVGLWLLAQGAELVRTDTLSGLPSPFALTPLLLSAVAAWLVYRGTSSAVSLGAEPAAYPAAYPVPGPAGTAAPGPSGRTHATVPGASHRPPSPRQAALIAGWVLAGYLTVAAFAVVYALRGPVPLAPFTALYVPLFAAAAAVCGAWSGCGRPPLARRLGLPPRYGEEAVVAARAAGIGGAVLLGAGALLTGASLAWHAGPAAETYAALSGPYQGRIAVFAAAVALVPNAAVWAASYGLGTGFAVGAGSVVAPAGVHAVPALPAFPLLAALPSGRSWAGWAALAAPVVAAGAVGWVAGHTGRSAWRTLRTVCGAAVLLGVGWAVTAAWAGGALGRDRMAQFGPVWWLSGASALAWTLVVALPAALVLRWQVAHPARVWALSGRAVPRPRLTAGSGSGEWTRWGRRGWLRPGRASRSVWWPGRAAGAGAAEVESGPGPESGSRSGSGSGSAEAEPARTGSWRWAGLRPRRQARPDLQAADQDPSAQPLRVGPTASDGHEPGGPGTVPPPPSHDPLPWPSRPPLPAFPPPLPSPPPFPDSMPGHPGPDHAPGPARDAAPADPDA